jgi:predicted lysophospholipase L1 biosynthesis ABC-type transport system permease subunit
MLGADGEIIGVVADAKDQNVTSEIEPQVFMTAPSPEAFGSTIFYVRAVRSAADLLGAVRQTAARVDPLVPIINLRTMRHQVRENLATERYVAAAAGTFATLATLLAVLGLYGVLAYAVAQRSREIGLRFALGAPAHRIRRMVLRQTVTMTSVGVALGVVAAWLLGRAARSVLFGVEAADPLALGGAAAVLAAVTLGAAYFPARRASRVDPIVVLRYE